MMGRLATIARAEWRLWLRSRLALGALLIFALLLISTSVVTALRMSEAHHGRTEQQAGAEATFLSQPDRHPHRMVHYGHYVFRAPPPLSMIDPGVDSVTGQSMFLEGHRQNTAMFADVRASAELGGFEDLTTALVYQLFLPLLLIAIGHGLIIREREENTLVPLLAQGVTGMQLYAGQVDCPCGGIPGAVAAACRHVRRRHRTGRGTAGQRRRSGALRGLSAGLVQSHPARVEHGPLSQPRPRHTDVALAGHRLDRPRALQSNPQAAPFPCPGSFRPTSTCRPNCAKSATATMPARRASSSFRQTCWRNTM